MNLTDSIHSERGLDLKGAREHLVERLLDGSKVNGLSIADLLDSDLDQGIASTKEVAAMLCEVADDSKDEHSRVEIQVRVRKFMQAIAERYVDSNADLIREQAEQDALEEQA